VCFLSLFVLYFVQLQSEVEKPLLTFRENFKKDMKRFDHHIADLRKQLVGRYAAVEKVEQTLQCSPALTVQMATVGFKEPALC